MSKNCQKCVFLFTIGLLLLTLVEGCGWFIPKLETEQIAVEEPDTEAIEPIEINQAKTEPANSETFLQLPTDVVSEPVRENVPEDTQNSVRSEPKQPDPVAITKEPTVPEDTQNSVRPEPKQPDPVVITREPAVVPKPITITKPKEPVGVNSVEPVKQDSPVNQEPPVDTKSPVNESSPVQGSSLAPSLLRWLSIVILVLQDEESGNAASESIDSSPEQPQPRTRGQRGGMQPPDGRDWQGRQERGQREKGGEPPEGEQMRPMPPGNLQGTPNAMRSPTESTPSVVQTPRLDPSGKIRFSFRYAPWKDVIEWFADQAGLSLQADKMPTGTLNLTDSDYYTPTEGLDILNSSLQYKEYTLVRKGKVLFVLYLPDGIPANLLEPIMTEDLETRGKYEICRVVFNLNRTTPEIVQAEIEGLLGPQGGIISMPRSQQIAVTETGGTLRTIRDIIRRIDDPDSLNTGTFQVVDLKNLTAEEALQMMRTLLAIEVNDSSLRTASDPSGKKIFLSGRGDMIERAKEVLTRIDSAFGSDDPMLTGQPQYETYDASFADPATVFAVLQTLLARIPDPGMRFSMDSRTGVLSLLARPTVHATVNEAIKQMKLNAPQINIIPLKRMSPLTAVDTIKKFYQTYSPLTAATTTTTNGRGGSLSNTSTSTYQAPTVEADTMARQIIVRGTLSQITEIRTLLSRLGEDGTASTSTATSARVIPLSPTAQTLVLEQLQAIVPTLDIKVNMPAMPKPSEPEPAVPAPAKEDEKNIDDLINEVFETELPMIRLLRITENPFLAQVASAGTQPEVSISITPGGIILNSDDPEALAKIDELIRMLSDESVLGKIELKKYDIVHATASVLASSLNTLMGATSTGSVTGVASVDLPEWQHSEVAGLIGAQGNAIEKTGTVTVTVDERLNALLIQANAVDHKTIEKLLKILDQPNRDDIMNRATPRFITLHHMRVDEAKASVEKVFANRMQGTSNSSRGGQSSSSGSSSGSSHGQSSGEQPSAMPMPPGGMGGMGGMGGQMPPGLAAMVEAMGRGRGGNTPREQEPPMTLDVHVPTNSLIVSSTESLFKEVEAFVQGLDTAVAQQVTVTETVKLEFVTPTAVQQSLTNLLGPAVTFSSGTQTRSLSQTGMSPFGGVPSGTNPYGNMPVFGSSGMRPSGSTFGGGTIGGGTNPFMNTFGGGMRPSSSTFGGGTIGGGMPTFGR